MLKTYSETLLLRTCNCDLNGKWKLSDMLAFMQEGSGMHSFLLGCGRDTMLAENIVWVLSRTELVIDRYPAVGETIRMETFPTNNKRWFFPRSFIMYDEQDQMIAKANTLWLLMDVVERKMASPEAALQYLPDNSDLEAPLPFPGNIAVVEGQAKVSHRAPVYSDIDVNQHVNNTRYADWLCDTLGIDTMKAKEVARLLIHYTHEIRPEQGMELALTVNGDSFRLSGEHEGEKHFDMGGVLRARG